MFTKEYIDYRQAVIEKLERISEERDKKDFYIKQLHNLLIPSEKAELLNLWLLDECLVFHRYIASDLPLKQAAITDSQSQARPDILLQQAYMPKAFANEPLESLNSITIVELKRPQRDDYSADNTPVNQVLSYVRKLRESKIRLADGRLLPNRGNMPFYAYILADLTPSLKEAVKMSAPYLTKMPDGSSYLGYHPKLDIYVEVIDYNGLLHRAKERNKLLFGKLGLF